MAQFTSLLQGDEIKRKKICNYWATDHLAEKKRTILNIRHLNS